MNIRKQIFEKTKDPFWLKTVDDYLYKIGYELEDIKDFVRYTNSLVEKNDLKQLCYVLKQKTAIDVDRIGFDGTFSIVTKTNKFLEELIKANNQ